MDASEITRRRQNKTIAGGFVTRMNSNQPTYGASLGFAGDSIVNNVKEGLMKNIVKCNGSFNVDKGCPCAEAAIEQPEEQCVESYTASIFKNMSTGTQQGQFNKLIDTGSNIIGIINTPYITLQTPAPTGVPLNLLKPLNTESTPASLLNITSNTSRGYGIIVSYGRDGALNWITKIDTAISESDIGVSITDIAFDTTGIYVCGTVGSLTGNPTPGSLQLNLYNAVTSNLTTNTPDKFITMNSKYQNGFVVKYNFDGTLRWWISMQGVNGGLGTTPKIYAANGFIYWSGSPSGNISLNFYNSLGNLKSTLTGTRYLALCAITQSGDIQWVDKVTFSGTLGSFSNVSIIYESNVLYLCFNTYNQIMQVYATNLTNPLADPNIIIGMYDYNNGSIPYMTTTNGMKTIVLALTDNNGIRSIKKMYAIKSILTTNLSNNLNAQVMKLTDTYLVLGGWFTSIARSTSGTYRSTTPTGTINGYLLMLNKNNFDEYRFFSPDGSESRVSDLDINGNNIVACGLSNGTVTFTSETLPDLQFTAQGANDAIIYSYNFVSDNINWITTWQSPTFENATCILNSGSCYYIGGYVDSTTNFYTPNLGTRLPNTKAALTYTATARSPNLSIFTVY